MSKPVQIFLCHASEDKPKVIEVYHFLKQQGFKPWLDKEDLLPGQRWDQEIPKALKASDFILVFLSQKSVSKRGYVQREFKLALDVLEEIPEGQIFVIPVRLDACAIPARFHLLHYCDLFEDGGLEKVVRAIRASLQSGHQRPTTIPAFSIPIMQPPAVQPQVLLRARAVENFYADAVEKMLREKDFFDSSYHKEGKGLKHMYEVVTRNRAKLVMDRITGLTWQQSGSEKWMIFAKSQEYAENLNHNQFAGFSDWRLPTVEEAMSLMEPEKMNGDLHIDSVFEKALRWIWTADKKSASVVWLVSFSGGNCRASTAGYDGFVRVVRSGLV